MERRIKQNQPWISDNAYLRTVELRYLEHWHLNTLDMSKSFRSPNHLSFKYLTLDISNPLISRKFFLRPIKFNITRFDCTFISNFSKSDYLAVTNIAGLTNSASIHYTLTATKLSPTLNTATINFYRWGRATAPLDSFDFLVTNLDRVSILPH